MTEYQPRKERMVMKFSIYEPKPGLAKEMLVEDLTLEEVVAYYEQNSSEPWPVEMGDLRAQLLGLELWNEGVTHSSICLTSPPDRLTYVFRVA